MTRTVTIATETWPLAKPFVIARGQRSETQVVVVSIEQDGAVGRGESTPTARYGETCTTVTAQLREIVPELSDGLSRTALQQRLAAGAARNAVDAALWDLEAKLSGKTVAELTALPWPDTVNTVQTISLLSPDEMAAAAVTLRGYPLIKVKLNDKLVLERVEAVHAQAPQAKLLVDANESWSMDLLQEMAPRLVSMNVVVIEQPLPTGRDEALAFYRCPLPLAADESCHTRAELAYLRGKYDIINIKLDKTGGLTEALALLHEASSGGLQVMVGCMLGTSLGIAPAMFVATRASYVDLDAPALLARDRRHKLVINNGVMSALPVQLWGC
ncbi:L-Ala-D/L-Glu epimerase [Exilibacterium tricleocarpae]|uniref:Dipeptide epimerase n=1 Tax=Exilibacterium tricleocarpae TaxID=2591008 RepID=A0A545SQJ6_9GAMM|nr:N-acetyl-D-Glu racemase DgcA [Exilibacterium tricleocarpae]TQV67242.1 L-Ala-D/L-Glu epimerase [Exilibacterium tricleocarpae]